MQRSETQLHPNAWHPSWLHALEPEDIDGLGASRPHDLLKWVVRLQFEQDNETKIGSGFFLNVPASQWYVILTAAHNLVDEGGKQSENLLVESSEHKYAAKDLHSFKICPDYEKSCRKDKTKGHNADVDYGAILISRDSNSDNIGFGFALEASQKSLADTKLNLIGYKPREEISSDQTKKSTEKLAPDARSGPCIADKHGCLTYNMTTAPGLSGSPVYIPFKGYDTVVGIHNNGETSGKTQAKGARLSCETLERIFDWVELVSREKALRAEQTLTPEDHGSKDNDPVYLHFVPQGLCEPGKLWACIHRTKAGLTTYFDVLPAYSSPSSTQNKMLWAFRLRHADTAKRQWVLWNIVKREVTLTDSLQEYCFVCLVTQKPKVPRSEGFWIVLTDVDKGDGKLRSLCQLAMDARLIQKEDLTMGQVNWPHLVFLKHAIRKVEGKQVRSPASPFDFSMVGLIDSPSKFGLFLLE